MLLLQPDILLMDEPTKGLDAEFKQAFAAIVQSLLAGGVTVLMVSHDVEFCARWAHRCALFFDGSIVADAAPRAFFSGNSFYTTSANRMVRGLQPQAVTPEDVMAVIGGELPPRPRSRTAMRRCRSRRRRARPGSRKSSRGGARPSPPSRRLRYSPFSGRPRRIPTSPLSLAAAR